VVERRRFPPTVEGSRAAFEHVGAALHQTFTVEGRCDLQVDVLRRACVHGALQRERLARKVLLLVLSAGSAHSGQARRRGGGLDKCK